MYFFVRLNHILEHYNHHFLCVALCLLYGAPCNSYITKLVITNKVGALRDYKKKVWIE